MSSSTLESLLAEMRANPKGVRFVDACRVATHYFGEPRQNGTSHKVWRMPWPGDPRINMQAGEGGKAKPYQVRQAVAAIDALLALRGAPPAGAEPAEPAPSERAQETTRKPRRR